MQVAPDRMVSEDSYTCKERGRERESSSGGGRLVSHWGVDDSTPSVRCLVGKNSLPRETMLVRKGRQKR